MARYRKVDVRIWVDDKVSRLSRPQPCGQALWFYLLTNPQTTSIPGLFRAGEAAMAEELRWSLKGFREAFAEVSREGLAEADWTARVVWIPGAIKYHRPENPNVIKSWAMAWDEIPDCALKAKAYEALKSFAEGLGKGFAEAFAKVCANPLANQEQEQEQEQEKDTEVPPASLGGGVRVEADSIREVFDHYRTHHPRSFPKPNPKSPEWAKIAARLREGYSVADLKTSIDGYHRSPWHQGQNDRGTKFLGLELIVRDGSHVAKGLELATVPAPTFTQQRGGAPALIPYCEFHRRTVNREQRAPKSQARLECPECQHTGSLLNPRAASEPASVGDLLAKVGGGS